jgi:hypothetical protein
MLTRIERARARRSVAGRAYFFAGLGPSAARGVCDLIEGHALFADMPRPYALSVARHPELGPGLLVSPGCRWSAAETAGGEAAGPEALLRRLGQIPTSMAWPSWAGAPDYRADRAGTERFHKWERIRPNIYRGVLR